MTTIRVRVTCFWEAEEKIIEAIRRYGRGSLRWKNLQFVTGDDYDRLVIFTRPHKDMTEYDPGKAITFLTEPPASSNVRDHWTSGISPMYLPLPFHPTKVRGAIRYGGNGGRIKKDRLLSCVTSDLNFMEGHFYRLRLIDLLDKRVEEGLDLYGKGYGNTFFERVVSYKGELADKYDGLWRYKYHFACENSFVDNYFTEKIADPIIAETLCFYDGCRNLEEFIDERAFIRVDVKKPFEAVDRITLAIGSNEFARRRAIIRQQKKRLLTKLNPLNIIWMVLNGRDVIKECKL